MCFDTNTGNLRINAHYSYKYMGMVNNCNTIYTTLLILDDLFLHKAKMHKTADGELSDRYSIFINSLSAIRLRS